jgi:pathogenesis-related protein 1
MKLAIYAVLLGLSLAAEVEDQNELNAPPVHNVQARSRSKRDLACASTPTRMTPAQAQEAVSSQNLLRSMEPAADMLALSWNDELAARAQVWADQCQWFHSMLYDCDNNRVGQNMFVTASANGYPILNMTDVARTWLRERSDWNFATATCNIGKLCGFFTQLAWSRTSKVGCGYAQCPRMAVDGSILNNAILVVCDYSPPGNVEGISGDLLPTYMPGPACSSCDRDGTGAGYKCNNNLCELCSPITDATCRCGNPSQNCQNGGVWSNVTCSCQCSASNEFYGAWCDLPCRCDDQMPSNCPDWRSSGYCLDLNYRDFMLTNCAKTCDFPCKRPPTCTSTARSN